MTEDNRTPIDPAAVTLMASIVAKSLKEYADNNPQVNLSSDSAVREISENVAVDMISAVAHLASQVTAVGEAPTRPQSARQRAVKAYKSSSSINKPRRNDFLDRLGMSEDQYPETD